VVFSSFKVCSLDSCSRKRQTKLYCKGHYQRWYRTGDVNESQPLDVKSKGRKPGFKHSAETIERIRSSKTGISKRQPKGFKKPNHSGENHWNWKGGITSADKNERLKFWKTVRPLVFERDNFTCTVCHVTGGDLQVDHINKWSDYPELRFELDNCRTLCVPCHYYVTFKRKLYASNSWGKNLGRLAT